MLFLKSRKSLKRVIDSGLNKEHFSYREEEYKWILLFYQRHDKIPEIVTFRREFPHFEKADSKEPTSFLIEEVKKAYKLRKFQEIAEAINASIEDDQPDVLELTKRVNKMVLGVNIVSAESQAVDYASTLEERLEQYKARKVDKYHGILTPWKTLNELLLGFSDSQFVGIVGKAHSGKTWVMLLLALYAWKEGYNVFIVTKEMSIDEIRRRLDSLMFELPYKKLRSGQLSSSEESEYFGYDLEADNKLVVGGDLDDSTSSSGLMALREEIKRVNPDIVFVDGAYLIDDDQGARGTVEQLKNLSRGFKKLARAVKVPVLVTLQQGKGSSRKEGGDMEDVQWSSAFSQDCDTMLEVYGEIKSPVRYLKLLKQREGELGEPIPINFQSREKIDFTEIESMQDVIDSQKGKHDRPFKVG